MFLLHENHDGQGGGEPACEGESGKQRQDTAPDWPDDHFVALVADDSQKTEKKLTFFKKIWHSGINGKSWPDDPIGTNCYARSRCLAKKIAKFLIDRGRETGFAFAQTGELPSYKLKLDPEVSYEND